MERYLKDQESDDLKGYLYDYLKDKAKRRAGITSGNAYEAMQGQLMKQKGLYDAGNLVAGASEGASMLGTLGGQRAQSSIIPAMNEGMYKSSQGLANNFQNLRNLEETSNINDLRVADYLTDREQVSDELDIRKKDQESQASMDALKRQQLMAQLQAKAATKRKLNPNLVSPSGSPVLLDEEGNPKNLEGYKLRDGVGSGAASWQVIPGVTGDEGNLLERNPKTGQTRPLELPKGFKSKNENDTDKAEEKSKLKIAENLESKSVNSVSVANIIDSQIEQIQIALKKKDKSLALGLSEQLLKAVNSPMGSDAIGAEEAKRLGYYLQNIRANVFSDNFGLGPDIDSFAKYATGVATSIRNASKKNLETAKQLRDGSISTSDIAERKNNQPNKSIDDMTEEELDAELKKLGVNP